MSLDPGSAAIIQLAWARRLGLDDGAFARALETGERITRVDDSAHSVEFVRLFGSSALVGPQWALDAAAGISDEEMAQHVTLLTITRRHGGHGQGSAALFFADDLPLLQPAEELTVSHGNPEAIELEGLCPPDDVNEVGLSDLENRYTIMHDDEGQRVPGGLRRLLRMGRHPGQHGGSRGPRVAAPGTGIARGLGGRPRSPGLRADAAVAHRRQQQGLAGHGTQPGLFHRRHPNQRAARLTSAAPSSPA